MNNDKKSAIIIETIADYKAQNLLDFNISAKSCDIERVVIATATSTQHSRGIINNVRKKAKELNIEILGIEGYEFGEWILIDFGHLVVHIMLEQIRQYYDLEKIWSV